MAEPLLDVPEIFDQLSAAMRPFVSAELVTLSGTWSEAIRRVYRSPEQEGSGSGPFDDVRDIRFEGRLVAGDEIGAIGFLVTPDEIYWAKSPIISRTLPVEMSLHAFADYRLDRSTFATRIAGAFLPGVPVRSPSTPVEQCIVTDRVVPGSVTTLADVDGVTFRCLILPRRTLAVGRHRLWRLRDTYSVRLSPTIRELLTRRRSGTIRSR